MIVFPASYLVDLAPAVTFEGALIDGSYPNVWAVLPGRRSAGAGADVLPAFNVALLRPFLALGHLRFWPGPSLADPILIGIEERADLVGLLMPVRGRDGLPDWVDALTDSLAAEAEQRRAAAEGSAVHG